MARLNKNIYLTPAMFLFAASVSANTADLRVVGTIAPPACTITFDNNGVVNYGSIPSSDLNATTETALAPRRINYTIRCDSPMLIYKTMGDARAGTAVTGDEASPGGPIHYGFGFHDNRVEIGSYTMNLLQAGSTGDGDPVQLLYRNGSVDSWNRAEVIDMRHDLRQKSFARLGMMVPEPYSVYRGTIEVLGFITPRNRINLNAEVNLDGLSFMTINYM
jgi:hypothetical protein